METAHTPQTPASHKEDSGAVSDFQAAVDQIWDSRPTPLSPEDAERLYDKLNAVFS